MIPQGYPLWAMEHPSAETPEPDGTVYVVVGWDSHARTPYLVALGVDWRHTWRPSDGQVFTFTTTDPREPANPILVDAASRNLADLRQRLTVLAQDAYRFLWNGEQVASKILEELNK